MKRENAWNSYGKDQLKELEALCAHYRSFLDQSKTERECVKSAVVMAEAAGYRNLAQVIKDRQSLKAGDRVYAVSMKKTAVLFHLGTRALEEGMNILAAHIDSPRLDVKQNPLYEEGELAYLDTHYYGGIKKYQWAALPLAIHGVVVKKDGRQIPVVIGESEEEPVVGVTDLLPHLAKVQMEKKASDVIEGEKLDVLIGSRPLAGQEQEAVKACLLKLFKDSYGIEEDDFLSAELEIVPAGKAREAGLDRSMIMAYGQDDRVCAFTSLAALLNVDQVERTSCCILTDKEEIGSVGATGMESRFFENVAAELMDRMGEYSELKLRRCLANSRLLSSDVNAAYDPLYADAYESRNASFLGKGMVFNKFTGARGKSGSNDANAEYIARLRRILDEEHIHYQFAELGKAGGPSPISRPATGWRSSTAASPSSICTPPGRLPARPTSMKRKKAMKLS